MTRLKTALMVAVISGLLGTPAIAASEFEKGSDFYAKGQFHAACEAFVDAICANPKYYPAHYALANSYMKIGKLDQAQTEYEMCLELYPDKVTKANCNRALDYLTGTSTGKTAVSSNHVDAMLAAEGQRRAEKAQLALEQKKSAIEQHAHRSAERVKQEAKAEVESLRANSPWWTLDAHQGKLVPVVQEEAGVMGYAERQAAHMINSAKAQCESMQPSLGTTDVTDGLRTQINRPGPSGVRLSPVGTSVHVRNYEVAGKAGGVR